MWNVLLGFVILLQCSVTCGKGVRTRRVICADNDGKELGKDGCNGSNKPVEETQECVVGSCYGWHVENWAQVRLLVVFIHLISKHKKFEK